MTFTKKILPVAVSAVVAFSALSFSGCSREQVPPAHYGKILSAEGYSPELLPTGKFWLAWWNDMVLLEGSTQLIDLPTKVTMAEYTENSKGERVQVPGLDMQFVLSLRYSIRPDEKVIQAMFSSLTIDPNTGVTANNVFNIYARNIIETAFRDLVGSFTPEEIFTNRATISNKFGEVIVKLLENTPIQIEKALVKKMTLPSVIVERIKTTKDTELAQAQENERQKVVMITKNNKIALERKESERQLVAATGAAAANIALAEGLNPQVLELRELEIRKIYAEAFKARMEKPAAGDTVFLPFDSLNNPGAQVKMFSPK